MNIRCGLHSKNKCRKTDSISSLINFSTFLAEIVSVNTLISAGLNKKKKVMVVGKLGTASEIWSINIIL